MDVKISTKDLNLYYGANHALKNVSLDLYANKITAFIGPSGCGKSTYLKTLNRMNDLVPNVKIEGKVLLDGEDIYDPKVDTTILRKKVGMVFQQPNPFPMSIYDNVAYGPRIHGLKNKAKLDEIVEQSLRGAALWRSSAPSAPDTRPDGRISPPKPYRTRLQAQHPRPRSPHRTADRPRSAPTHPRP